MNFNFHLWVDFKLIIILSVLLIEVSAHRFLLAAVSPVFRREFHGPLATSKDVIDIKETTIDAFRMMVNYIYHPGVVKDINCPQLLCQMLNLAERC